MVKLVGTLKKKLAICLFLSLDMFNIGDLITNRFREKEVGLIIDIQFQPKRIYVEWNDGDICWYDPEELKRLSHILSVT